MGAQFSSIVIGKSGTDIEKKVDEEIERQHHRFRPDRLCELVAQTHFSRKELQLLYRGFKEVCLNGIVTKTQIEEVLGTFFPYGDPSAYASLVFATFDEDGNGEICFDEFVKGVSVISRGTFEDKVKWVFTLYDNDRKGYITAEDMQRIVKAMYFLMGYSEGPATNTATRYHAEAVFKKMDQDGNGSISHEEFIVCCHRDPAISASMELFCTVLDTTSKLFGKEAAELEEISI